MTETLDKRSSKTVNLLDNREKIFEIVITANLESQYSFGKLTKDEIREFQQFLNDTVIKKRTITEVEKMYLRTKGLRLKNKETLTVEDEDYLIVHYGKDNHRFRIFGYYNENGLFVLTRIDPKHKKHKV